MKPFPSVRLRIVLWLYTLAWTLGLPAILGYLWLRGRSAEPRTWPPHWRPRT